MSPRNAGGRERGMSLIELLIALVVLAVGVLAVGQMFPSGSRAQVQDHLVTAANDFVREKIEDLSAKSWADTSLTAGRHPSASGTESLGGGQWQRYYNVTVMAAPMDNLKRIDVTVTCKGAGLASTRNITASTYLRK